MLECRSNQMRQLILEGPNIKLKDSNSSGKLDVHLFLFTDLLLICKKSISKKSNDKVKVIRPPLLVDRLVPVTFDHTSSSSSSKDTSSMLVLIYVNEFSVASSVLILYTSECKLWQESIRKAQKKYSEAKARAHLSAGGHVGSSIHSPCIYRTVDEEDDLTNPEAHPVLLLSSHFHTPRSSRSSLLHSYSGSMEISEGSSSIMGSSATLQIQPAPPPPAATPNLLMMDTSSNYLMASNSSQPSRARSFELGELRNPSLQVDADAFGRSHSMETRSSIAVTITSPRPERRAFLLRGSGGSPSGSLSSNTLIVPHHSNITTGATSPGNISSSTPSGTSGTPARIGTSIQGGHSVVKQSSMPDVSTCNAPPISPRNTPCKASSISSSNQPPQSQAPLLTTTTTSTTASVNINSGLTKATTATGITPSRSSSVTTTSHSSIAVTATSTSTTSTSTSAVSSSTPASKPPPPKIPPRRNPPAGSLQRCLSPVNKPPLLKTKNLTTTSSPSASSSSSSATAVVSSAGVKTPTTLSTSGITTTNGTVNCSTSGIPAAVAGINSTSDRINNSISLNESEYTKTYPGTSSLSRISSSCCDSSDAVRDVSSICKQTTDTDGDSINLATTSSTSTTTTTTSTSSGLKSNQVAPSNVHPLTRGHGKRTSRHDKRYYTADQIECLSQSKSQDATASTSTPLLQSRHSLSSHERPPGHPMVPVHRVTSQPATQQQSLIVNASNPDSCQCTKIIQVPSMEGNANVEIASRSATKCTKPRQQDSTSATSTTTTTTTFTTPPASATTVTVTPTTTRSATLVHQEVKVEDEKYCIQCGKRIVVESREWTQTSLARNLFNPFISSESVHSSSGFSSSLSVASSESSEYTSTTVKNTETYTTAGNV